MTAKELNERRLKAIADARAIVDAAGDAGLSAEDAQKYDAHMAEASRYKEAIERVKVLEELEAEERNRAPEVVVRGSAPVGVPDEAREIPTEEVRVRQAVATPEYRSAFWRAVRRSWSGVGEAERRALQVGNDSEGGYTVPDSFNDALIQGLEDPVVMRSVGATVLQGVGGTREIPFVSAHGSATWTAEEAAAAESDETFGSVRIGAHKLTRLIKVSIELLQDSAFNLESYLASEFTRAFAVAEDTAFVSGNGAMRPLGFTLSGTAGITAAAVDAVTTDELSRLKFSLKRAYRKRSRWFMADATFSAISRLKDGDGRYVLQPGITLDAPDVLFGRPVTVSDDMPAMATGLRAVYFGDPAYYYIIDRGSMVMQILRELFSVNGQVGFLGYRRTDGRLILNEAMRYITMA